MNILPKKRWHVRTKENIARVRKDEAEAAEKEREETLRTENADREARLNILKHKSKQRLLECGVDDTIQQEPIQEVLEHINLFTDIDHAVKLTNKDHDKEIKDKKEEYEKKIGYLTYLGQDSNEVLKKKNWYEVLPSSRFSQSSNIKDTYEKLVLKDQDGKPKKKDLDVKDGELDWKTKQRHDPLNKFKEYCAKKIETKINTKGCNKKEIKHKSCNKIKKTKDRTKNKKEIKLQLLREARIKREQQEKHKTELFLSGLNKTSANTNAEINTNKIKPKYNSQFNPELARQNYT